MSIPMLGQHNEVDSLLRDYYEMDSLSEYNYNLGNDSIAISYANNALNIIQEIYGKKHQLYAHVLNDLARYKFETGDYEEAKDYVLEAIEIQKGKYSNTKDYAESLSTLSDILTIEGDFSHAIEMCNKSIAIKTTIFGPGTIEVAIAKGNLADIYYDCGYFSKALQLCNEAIDIISLIEISNDSDYATIVSIRSKANTGLGLYLDALSDAKKSLDVFVNLYGEQYISNAALLSNISLIYSYLGNYSEAYRYGEKALRIYEQTYGEQHPYYVVTLQNIADYKYENGELAECIQLAERAYNICSQNNDNDSPMYILVSSKILLSRYHFEANNNDKALKLLNEVIRFLQQSNNTNTDEYASALLVLADIYSKMGIHDKAIKCATESTQIMEKIYGQDNIRYSQFIDVLSCYYSNSYRYKEAEDYAMLSMKIRKKFIVANYSDMSSLQKKNLWSRFGHSFFRYAGLAYRNSSPKLLSDIYDNVCLFAKGVLLSSELSMMQLIAESKDSVLINDYTELLLLKERFNKLCEQPLIDNNVIVDSLTREIQSREIGIIRKSKSYGNYMSYMNVSWKQIQQELGPKDIAVEFIDFPIKNDSIIYAALFVRKGYKYPHFIPLFELKEISAINKREYYVSSKLYELVWGQMKNELVGIENIYFSPSGELHKIGIEYLSDKDGQSLCEKYKIYRLSSTRQLALSKKIDFKKRAVLYGGIDYEAKPYSPDTKVNVNTYNHKIGDNHAQVDSLSLRGAMGYLEGTKREADTICANLEQHKWDYTYYSATKGTEKSFKLMNGNSPSILHIATHGFYMTEADAMKERELSLRNSNMSGIKGTSYREDRPMTRSGLLLSGCNRALNHEDIPDNEEDGILTAQEIASLDLRGLDLVVLSACETGLGDIASGEGVFGLQRGFKKAGASTIIMSLWKVSDNATQMLMTAFYKYYLDGMSKYDAFSKARNELKKVCPPRQTKPDWAAFVMLDGLN